MHYPFLRELMVAMLTLVVRNGVAFAGPLEDAQAALHRGDYATALQLYTLLANGGNVAAQTSLGVMYAKGQGVPKDDKEAVKWDRLAAERGYAPAQAVLGKLYNYGQGVAQDSREAVKWNRLAS